MLIFLIGQSGSGKSYWASRLGALLQIDHLDMDSMIEQEHKKTIAAIFAENGLAFFREEEQKMLLTIIQKYGNSKDVIIATGGGAPCYANSMDMMLQHGLVIYLQASVILIAQRLANAMDRPLLAAEGQEGMVNILQEQLSQRKAIYERAHYKVDAATATSATFAAIVESVRNQK